MSQIRRFTAERPCPICGGWDRMHRGQGTRCHGYLGSDGTHAHCAREDLAGALPREKGDTYAHRLAGPCRCGREHAPAPPATSPRAAPARKGPGGRIVATYAYHGASGELLFEVVRKEPKAFLQRRPDGKGGWEWGLKGLEPVPYRLPELLGSDPAAVVFVAEGEKDVDRLRAAGLVATCNAMGAGKWRDDYSPHFRGRHVAILPDQDGPGRDHARQVARSLLPFAASVKVLDLAGACRALGLGELPEKGDASDFLELGGTAEALLRLAEEAPPFDPLAPADGGEDLEGEGEAAARETQDQALLRLAEGVELFHTEDGAPYAVIMAGRRREAVPIGNGKIRLWLNGRYYEEHGRLPSSDAVQKALTLMEYRATLAGPCLPAAVRVAEAGGARSAAYFIDLGDDEGRAVRVAADGWSVVDSREVPVPFRRPKGLRPLPVPRRGGGVDELRRFINLPDDEGRSWRLLVACLGAYLQPDGPFPVLAINGEQGSAKSTLLKLVRLLVDPNAATTRSEPREERDLMIAAGNAWVQSYDNLDSLPAWLSNALCRLSTGGGYSTRALFTDDEEKIIEAMRPVVLSGIEDLASRADLLERCIVLHLPAITEGHRRREREFWDDFRDAWPGIFGGLLDGAAGALRLRPSVRLDRLPRMADFAHWAECFGRALGWEPGAFLEAYSRSIEDATETALEGSPVAAAVIDFMGSTGSWEGTATELLALLSDRVGQEAAAAKQWPKRPNTLSGQLTRIAPALRKLGIDFARPEGTHKNGRRLVLRRIEAEGDDPPGAGGRSGDDGQAGGSLPGGAAPKPHLNGDLRRHGPHGGRSGDDGDDRSPDNSGGPDPGSGRWREVLAGWPLDRRKLWGLRANELAEAGVPFPEHELRAFEEIAAETGEATRP